MALAFPESLQPYDAEPFPGIFDVDLDLENQVWPMGNTSLTQFGDVFDAKDDLFSFGAAPKSKPGKRKSVKAGSDTKSVQNKRRKASNSKSKAAEVVDITHYPGLSETLTASMNRARAASLVSDPLSYEHAAYSDTGLTQMLQDDFKELSTLWLPEAASYKPKVQPALKKRTTTAVKPKPKRSYKPRKAQTRTLSLLRTKQILDEIDNRKRLKWSEDENFKLWRGISIHGNNWTEVKKEVTTRSYDQIKDKGRRLLFVEGWKTGRKKKSSDEAMDYARNIALRVLKTLKTKKTSL